MPPFWVAGVVITEAQRSAVLVVLDEARRDVGLITVRESESYGGYRLATVEPSRVLFERGGTVFPVVVGRPYAGPRGTADAAPRAIFIPGPDKPKPDVEYMGPQVKRGGKSGGGSGASAAPSGDPPDPEALKKFLEHLFSHPQIQKQVQEMKPIIQQEMDRARQDGQGTAEAAAPTSNALPAPHR
jgi:hypothetical protein